MAGNTNDHEFYVNGRFMNQVATGVQRYAWEITKRIHDLRIIYPKHKLSPSCGHLWEQCILPRHIRKKALLWSPGGSGPLQTPNQVVTIHDIAQIEHPEWYSIKFAKWYAWLTPRLLARAAHVLTVSEFSRQRIIDYYNVDPVKVSAIPLGVNNMFFRSASISLTEIRLKYGLPERYVLTVGSTSPRKNLPRILSTWKMVSPKHQDVSLVVVGHPALRFAPNLSLSGVTNQVVFTGYVPDVELPLFYQAAEVFLYPSLYEGFGLPVLEAMAAGSPVITSNSTSLSEFSSMCTVQVNPESDEDIAAALNHILEDPELRTRLRQAGPVYAKEYAWERTAKQTYRVLKQVASELYL